VQQVFGTIHAACDNPSDVISSLVEDSRL